MIKGEHVILLEQEEIGRDPFGAPVFQETPITVEDVLIGTPSTDDVVQDLQLYGKSLFFTLGIPKGDTHDWKDKTIIIRGMKFRSYGFPLTQTAENVPTRWNTQVKVERYE